MKMMPLLADHVKVEAGFGSYSTLLIISLTVPLWCYFESHPAISLIGIIKSSNQVTRVPPLAKTLCEEIIEHEFDSIEKAKPTSKTLKWGQHAKALIQLYKFNKDEPYFELLPGISSTPTTPARLFLENVPYVCSHISPLQPSTNFLLALLKHRTNVALWINVQMKDKTFLKAVKTWQCTMFSVIQTLSQVLAKEMEILNWFLLHCFTNLETGKFVTHHLQKAPIMIWTKFHLANQFLAWDRRKIRTFEVVCHPQGREETNFHQPTK
jgi:hypothetical protein